VVDVGVVTQGDEIVREFNTRFYDTERFFDTYAKGKVAQYLLAKHAGPDDTGDKGAASRLVEEAQLFIEAAHAAEARMAGQAPKAGGIDIEAPASH